VAIEEEEERLQTTADQELLRYNHRLGHTSFAKLQKMTCQEETDEKDTARSRHGYLIYYAFGSHNCNQSLHYQVPNPKLQACLRVIFLAVPLQSDGLWVLQCPPHFPTVLSVLTEENCFGS
jgi:hypothetical protein